MSNQPYTTNELELASFLKARGVPLLNAQLNGRFVDFIFATQASREVENYFSGASLPARELFEAHRSLRALITQVKQHRNGTDYVEHSCLNQSR